MLLVRESLRSGLLSNLELLLVCGAAEDPERAEQEAGSLVPYSPPVSSRWALGSDEG